MQNYHYIIDNLKICTYIGNQNINLNNITSRGPCQTWSRLRRDSWSSARCWECSSQPPQSRAGELGPASSATQPGRWWPLSSLTSRMSPPSSSWSNLRLWSDLPITKICQFGHQTTVGPALPENQIRLPFRLQNGFFSVFAKFFTFISSFICL